MSDSAGVTPRHLVPNAQSSATHCNVTATPLHWHSERRMRDFTHHSIPTDISVRVNTHPTQASADPPFVMTTPLRVGSICARVPKNTLSRTNPHAPDSHRCLCAGGHFHPGRCLRLPPQHPCGQGRTSRQIHCRDCCVRHHGRCAGGGGLYAGKPRLGCQHDRQRGQ